jgi:hypothetical protein
VVRQLRLLLRDGFGIRRSDTQVTIHQTIIEAMLPKLYFTPVKVTFKRPDTTPPRAKRGAVSEGPFRD